MSMQFSHITFIVSDLNETLGAYKQLLDLTTSEGIVQDLDEARLATIHLSGPRLEFIEPDMSIPSPFTEFMEEKGEGIISYCLVLDDFDERVAQLKQQGASIQEATQEELFPDHTLRIAWILPEENVGCRVELVDRDSLPPQEIEIIEGEG